MKHVDALIARLPELAPIQQEIEKTVRILVCAYRAGGKILLCGNGGSAADCEHIAGELLKGFLLRREASGEQLQMLTQALGDETLARQLQCGVPTVALTAMSGISTAFSNDVNAELVFAQQVFVLGHPSDVLIGLSTSGNSKNVVHAMRVARAMGLVTVSLTGEGGGQLAECSDVVLRAPATETFRVQEYHLPIYHAICAEVEHVLFS